MSEGVTTAPSAESREAGPKYNAFGTSVVLTLIMTAAYLDRSMMAFLVEPIKKDLDLTDVQVSLLIGAAFSLFYSAMNVPAGSLVDRLDRRKLMLGTGVLWSAASIACGLASGFWQILFARMILGGAEAFIGPCIYALMRDRIPPEKRGRSFSVLGMAPYFGGAMSLILGGALLRSAMAGGFAGFPLIASLQPWQIVIIAVGGLAFLPVLLLLLIAPDGARPKAGKGEGSFRTALLHIRKHANAYAILIGYAMAGSMIAFGVNSWVPTIMHRTYGIPLPQVGAILGPLALLFGLSGLVFCGYVLDRIEKAKANVGKFAAISMLISAGGAVAMPLMPQATGAWTLYCLSSFFTGAAFPISAGILSRITPSIQMGKVTALYLLCQSVVANAVGVTLIAFLSEQFFTGQTALGYALSLYCAIFGTIALVLSFLLDRAAGSAPDAA